MVWNNWNNIKWLFSSYCCSVVQLCVTACDFLDCSTLGLPVPYHLLELPKFMFIVSVMPSSHLILWHPLLLPSNFPRIRDFSSESSVHIRWPKSWSFSFSISPSSEYSGLISLKINWLDLFVVQGTFRSLLQHCSLKASILWFSAFFMFQLSTVRDHWGDHILDYTDLCWQSNVSFFLHTVWVCHHFPAKKQLSSGFIAAVITLVEFHGFLVFHRLLLLLLLSHFSCVWLCATP